MALSIGNASTHASRAACLKFDGRVQNAEVPLPTCLPKTFRQLICICQVWADAVGADAVGADAVGADAVGAMDMVTIRMMMMDE